MWGAQRNVYLFFPKKKKIYQSSSSTFQQSYADQLIDRNKDTMQKGTLGFGDDGGINIGFQASILHKPGYWSGLIDDVRIYDVALSAEEIAVLAQ